MCLCKSYKKDDEKQIIIENIDIDDNNMIREKMINYYENNEKKIIDYFNNIKITDITINYSSNMFISIFSLKYSPNELEDIILGSPFSRLHPYIFIDLELENYI